MSTLKTIAARAHVSVSTVSRALSDSYEVSDETREEILRIAKEVGYFGDKKRIRASYKKAGRLRAVILCPELVSTHYAEFSEQIVRAFESRGSFASVYSYSFNRDVCREMVRKCIDDPEVDALVLLSSGDAYLPDELSMPVAVFGRTERENVISFDNAWEAGFDAVVRHLLDTGRKKLAFAGEPLTVGKEKTFRRSCAKAGAELAAAFVSEGRFEEAGREAARYFLSLPELPDAVFCGYDEIACALVASLTAAGVKVPEEVAVIGINDIPMAKYCFGGLSTLAFSVEKTVLSVVDDLLAGRQGGRYFIPPLLVVRATG